MPFKKVSQPPKHVECSHPEHYPPKHVSLEPGVYEWECPLCRKTQKIVVPAKNLA